MGPWDPWGKNSCHAACSITSPASCASSRRGTWWDIQQPPSETAASSHLLPHSSREATRLHGGLRLALGTPQPPTASHSSIWWKQHAPATGHQAPLPRGG